MCCGLEGGPLLDIKECSSQLLVYQISIPALAPLIVQVDQGQAAVPVLHG